ncbi:MAG: HEAT repeat domain-containing protein [Candidatus Longimicrobiales bacterium M2_2A_002]
MATASVASTVPHRLRWIGVALATAGAASTAGGQTLAEIARAADGLVELAYRAASNVCGTGDGVLIREPDGSTMFVAGRVSHADWRSSRDGDPPCRSGDVRIRMRPAGDGGWTDVGLTVGGSGRERDDARGGTAGGRGAGAERGPGAPRQLGFVAGQEAADFLLDAARRSDRRAARDLILAAAIAADAEIWPGLLAMVRDRSLPSRVREAALHWLGRRAAREAVAELGGIVRDRTEDDRIREAAVFAISQLPDDQAIPMLVDVVRTMDDPLVVGRALFWLAEFDDPRAVGLFEEILAGG